MATTDKVRGEGGSPASGRAASGGSGASHRHPEHPEEAEPAKPERLRAVAPSGESGPLGKPVDKTLPTKGEDFYADILRFLNKSKIPYLVGGTYAVKAYVGITRATKDVDVFARPGDAIKILKASTEAGYKVQVEDERWIGKICKGKLYCDVIYSSANSVATVSDTWFEQSVEAKVLGVPVRIIPPTELVYSKVFIQDRYKFDGNDVAHLILTLHEQIDWKRLLSYLDQHWEVLLGHVLRFRFIYPSERERVPRWLLDELISRLTTQIDMPTPRKKACRGRLFSRDDFDIDVRDWGFADLAGDDRFT